MVSRRSVLAGMGATAIAQLLSACSGTGKEKLTVRLLKDSIPVQLLPAFRRDQSQQVKLNFKAETQLKSLLKLLEDIQKQNQSPSQEKPWWQLPRVRSSSSINLVTLGDYWLKSAIQKELIQPLPLEKLSTWQNLPSQWQSLVRRDNQGELAENGEIWGAPYRWGATVIAYDAKQFKAQGWEPPRDWSDLWEREEFRHQFSLLDQPREVIGLTLKKLGKSYNTEDLNQVPNLKAELLELNKRVKFYSSDAYLQPLILKDTALAVGWSTEIFDIQKSYPHIKAVMPASGSALWTDLWVQPASSNEETESKTLIDWIDFCWQEKSAEAISLLTGSPSPLANFSQPDLPTAIQDNPLMVVASEVLEKSDFLEPLPETTIKQYQDFWEEVRQNVL